MNISKICWNHLMYASGKEPTESISKEETKLRRWQLSIGARASHYIVMLNLTLSKDSWE